MAHSFEADGPRRFFMKFVTMQDANGDLKTKIHAPKPPAEIRDHRRLMEKMLQEAGVVDVIEGAGFPGLKAYDTYCIGGGRIDPSDIDWGSSTLQSSLGRDKPKDKSVADRIITEIREWIANVEK